MTTEAGTPMHNGMAITAVTTPPTPGYPSSQVPNGQEQQTGTNPAMVLEAGTRTQNGIAINDVTVPPTPAYPPSQVPSGQEQQLQMMPRPEAAAGCPPGLEYLTQLDQILVHQQVELLEVLTGFETENKYQIKNSLGQQVFFAAEESDFCMRSLWGSARSFVIHVVDNANQEVIRVDRPFKFGAGCCWFADLVSQCAHTVSVEAPPGQPIGHVRQRSSKWEPHFDILDANFEPLLKIRGPSCLFHGICDLNDIEFRLMSYDESQQVGKISKQWAGIVKEYATNADNFGITFPMDLDVKVKGTLLGALFLIDFMFFEVSAQQPNNSNGPLGRVNSPYYYAH